MKKTSIHSPFDFVIRPIHMDGFFDVDFADIKIISEPLQWLFSFWFRSLDG